MKMISKKILLLASIGFSAFYSAANAEDLKLNDNYYVQLNAGISASTKGSGELNKKMGKSGLYGIEAGMKLNEKFRLGLGFDYRTGYAVNTTKTYKVDEETPLDHTNDARYKIKSLVVMANVYYDIAEIKNFTPYVNLGFGLARNKTKYDSKIYADNKYVADEFTHTQKSVNNFAYKLGFGTRYSVSKQVDIDLRYNFINLGKFKTISSDWVTNGEDVSKPNRLTKSKLSAHEFLVGVVYKF
jgi:opacity protein-like surface antigen